MTAAEIETVPPHKRPEPGLEMIDGQLAGHDPREMSVAELEALGHSAMPPLAVIRAKCLECSAGSAQDVKACPITACPSWPFRMGKNPWRPPISEARRKASRRALSKMRSTSKNALGDPLQTAEAAG